MQAENARIIRARAERGLVGMQAAERYRRLASIS